MTGTTDDAASPGPSVPFYIVAPPFDRASAGNRALYTMAETLAALGYEAFVTIHEDYPAVSGDLPPDHRIAFLTQAIADEHLRDGRTPVIVYPEISKSLSDAGFRVLYLLNYPGEMGGPKVFPDCDYVLCYSRNIARHSPRADGVLFIPVSDPEYWTPGPEPEPHREGRAVYAGKYVDHYGQALPADMADAFAITRHLPGSPGREELRAILRSAECLHIFENTATAIEAALCGCPVVYHLNAYFPELIAEHETGLAGFTNHDGPAALAEARAGLPAFRERYEASVVGIAPAVARFACEAARGASAKRRTEAFQVRQVETAEGCGADAPIADDGDPPASRRPAVGTDSTDVVNAYLAFLARRPESDAAIAAKRTLDPAALVAELIVSDEFRRRIAGPVIAGRSHSLPPALDPFDPALARWAADFVPLSDSGRAVAARATTWRELLAVLCSDPVVRDLSPIAVAGVLAGRLPRALADDAGQSRRSLHGGIDWSDPGVVTGWSVDANDPVRTVRVTLYADGMFVGSVETGAAHREAQERFGDGVRAGFTLAFTMPRHLLRHDAVRLDLCEAVTGQTLAEATVSPDRQSDLDLVAAVQRQLDDAATGIAMLHRLQAGGGWRRWSPWRRHRASARRRAAVATTIEGLSNSLETIRSAVPDLRRRSGFSLGAWQVYHRCFYDYPRTDADVDRSCRLTSFIVEASEPGTPDVARLIATLPKQSDRWELLVTGAGAVAAVAGLGHAFRGDRIVAVAPGVGDRTATEAAIRKAKGSFLVFATRRDRFAPDAPWHLERIFDPPDGPLMCYWDEDAVHGEASGMSVHDAPKLKPPFDPELLRQCDPIGATFAIDRVTAMHLCDRHSVGMTAGGGEWAAAVLDAFGERAIQHVPLVLHGVETVEQADPTNGERHAEVAIRGRVAAGVAAGFDPADLDGTSAVVVVPTRDKPDLIAACVDGLIAARPDNRVRYRILIVDNGSTGWPAHRVLRRLSRADGVDCIRDDQPFNWAAINNAAVAGAREDVLIFLNDDTMPISRDWCDALCGPALRSDTGVVGARLLYEDATIQHAGMIINPGGFIGHEGVGDAAGAAGYLGRNTLMRRVTAVTGACLATRRSVFEALGGFDATRFPTTFNDVDYCMRSWARGLCVLYTPQCTMFHHESKTRGLDNRPDRMARHAAERAAFLAAWPTLPARDAFLNAHFDTNEAPFRRLVPPPAFLPSPSAATIGEAVTGRRVDPIG